MSKENEISDESQTLTTEDSTLQPPTNFRSYLFFLTGQMISIFGSSVVMFVIIWHLTDMVGENNTILSLAFFLGLLPMVILSPIAGVIADKYNKKAIIIIADSAQALITLVIILLFYLSEVKVWHILALNTLRSVCQAFHEPVAFSLIPQMVPKDKLSRINGITFFFISIIRIIGPLIGAWLMIYIFTEHILWLDIITFGVALFTILQIKIPKLEKRKSIDSAHYLSENEEANTPQAESSFFSQLKEGFRAIKEIKGFGGILILIIFANFIMQPIDVLIPNFIKYEHFGEKQHLGYFMGFLQLGMLVGGLMISLKKQWKRIFLIMSIGFYSTGIGMLFLGIIDQGNFVLLYLVAFFLLLTSPIINALLQTSIQVTVPPEKVGRVISVIVSLATLATPLGMIMSGLIADAIGSIRILYIWCGIINILIITFTLYSKKSRIFLKNMQEEQDKISKS
ncbi:MFS transporter [Candidatus Lokiarchaeum ossiferum]|uniref:MFS transporter n=1 Tax=Candidatus Lokiarchaeum ossiferum TaxID=2951803 RepID=UPI00352F248B